MAYPPEPPSETYGPAPDPGAFETTDGAVVDVTVPNGKDNQDDE